MREAQRSAEHDLAAARTIYDDRLVSIRMASTFAIQSAREVVATLYGAAGAMAIFSSRPFERRFRDIHTVTQQIQGHPEHFETVGQVTIEEVFKGWRKSPGHNKNLLLKDAEHMGIALVYDAKTEFKTFWTLVLGARG